jgi:hypothetical protein
MQCVLPPEHHSEADQRWAAPDPAGEIWHSTPIRHSGTRLNTKLTIYKEDAGASPRPSPSGGAAGEDLGSARRAVEDSQLL